jgi:hypothetical protein
MAQIVETVLLDRRISLGNEEYLRQLTCGSNWGKIRIGVRFAINGRANIPAGAGNAGPLGLTCFLQLGLGADSTSYFSADRPTQYCGLRFGGSSDNNPAVTFNAVQLNNSYYTWPNTEASPVSKDSTGVVTMGARLTTGGTVCAAANGNSSNEHELIATFGRAGGTYTVIDVLCPVTAGAVQAGKTFAQFQSDMVNESAASTVLSNVTRTAANSVLFPTTITAQLGWVSVYWSRSTPTIEISHIMVTKFF